MAEASVRLPLTRALGRNCDRDPHRARDTIFPALWRLGRIPPNLIVSCRNPGQDEIYNLAAQSHVARQLRGHPNLPLHC